MDLVDLGKYEKSPSFNLYINIYFNVEHSTTFPKFYDDIKKLCYIVYDYKILNLSGSDYFYLSLLPAEDNTVYQCNDSLPNMKKQTVKIFNTLIDNTFGEDVEVDTDFMNFKKLRINEKVDSFVANTLLPIKKAECYVVAPFVADSFNKSTLFIELYINKEHQTLGSISQNAILEELTNHMFYSDYFNVKVSHYFNVVVIARKEGASDSFKRLGGPYVYDSSNAVNVWKQLRRKSKQDHSKLYLFSGVEHYQYGKTINIYCAFPDKKNRIVSGDSM